MASEAEIAKALQAPHIARNHTKLISHVPPKLGPLVHITTSRFGNIMAVHSHDKKAAAVNKAKRSAGPAAEIKVVDDGVDILYRAGGLVAFRIRSYAVNSDAEVC